MNQRAWLILGLLLFGFTCAAQNKLLFHKNRFREAFYRIGDPLTFRIKSSNEKISGVINAISDTAFVIDQVSHKPSDIDRIYIDKKTRVWFFLKYKWKTLFLLGGVGFILIDAVNYGEIAQESLIIGGTLIAAGYWPVG